jgi:exodeoxyribonuclease VII small subunit
MTEAKKPLDFESSLSELEKLVARMEQGELTLKDSLDEFERGVQLVGACESALKEAELRVQVLLKGNDPTALKRFDS